MCVWCLLPAGVGVVVSKWVLARRRSYGSQQNYVQVRDALYGTNPYYSTISLCSGFARTHCGYNTCSRGGRRAWASSSPDIQLRSTAGYATVGCLIFFLGLKLKPSPSPCTQAPKTKSKTLIRRDLFRHDNTHSVDNGSVSMKMCQRCAVACKTNAKV